MKRLVIFKWRKQVGIGRFEWRYRVALHEDSENPKAMAFYRWLHRQEGVTNEAIKHDEHFFSITSEKTADDLMRFWEEYVVHEKDDQVIYLCGGDKNTMGARLALSKIMDEDEDEDDCPEDERGASNGY